MDLIAIGDAAQSDKIKQSAVADLKAGPFKDKSFKLAVVSLDAVQ